MKFLVVLLVSLFLLGITSVALPVFFPSTFFKMLESFLDWTERPVDWGDQ